MTGSTREISNDAIRSYCPGPDFRVDCLLLCLLHQEERRQGHPATQGEVTSPSPASIKVMQETFNFWNGGRYVGGARKEEKMYQADLKSGDTLLTCWVDKKIRVGNRVTLKKEPERWWNVLWVSQYHDEVPDSKWKVGGLG